MQEAAQKEAVTLAGHHAALYHLLNAGAAQRLLPPGTEGAIGRAEAHYDGHPEAVALLHEMNLTIFRLRGSLRAGAEEECRTQRKALARLADAWLYHAPLFHIAELLPSEGEA